MVTNVLFLAFASIFSNSYAVVYFLEKCVFWIFTLGGIMNNEEAGTT